MRWVVLPSGSRVRTGVDSADALAGQVRVQLRRADTRMAEQLLDDAQVGSALQQVGRERVAQRVRADAVREPGGSRGGLDDGPRLLACEPPPAVAEEQRAAPNGLHVMEREERRAAL